MSIPSSDSPVYDKTGNRCTVGQRGDVWFLAGSTGGRVTRKCEIPAGVSVLVPVINNFCFPDAAFTDDACTTKTVAFIDDAVATLQVDGADVDITRVSDTDDFNFTVGYNGYGGVKPGTYRATVADGLWALLGLFEADSQHTVHVVARSGGFSLDVTYTLSVVGPKNP